MVKKILWYSHVIPTSKSYVPWMLFWWPEHLITASNFLHSGLFCMANSRMGTMYNNYLPDKRTESHTYFTYRWTAKHFCPETVIIDFETAIREAIRSKSSNVQVVGRRFHLRQVPPNSTSRITICVPEVKSGGMGRWSFQKVDASSS